MLLRNALASLLFFSSLQAFVSCLQAQDDNDWKAVTEGERLFALTVAPALQAKCAACHGQDPEAIESGLVITSRDAVLKGGDSGESVLVPGKKEASWLYLSATWEHDDLQMPPKENDRLDAGTLEALGKWIDEGAPWPDAARMEAIRKEFGRGVTVATSGGLDSAWDERRYEPETLWAYQPLVRASLPAAPARGEGSYPAHNAVDTFINARLAELGIAPAPRADRRSLVRRLYFDLTGLPPTPRQVADFLDNPAADEVAWVELVDELLASPGFGEQWARHWLDTVRYADSAGFANDYQRPNAWRYRDYVMRCLNQDRPIDRFIQEQIAGDELNPQDPEMLVAVGMLRMGPWEQTGMSVDKVTRQLWLDDVTDMIGQAFLGHPLQCARCHDHKFDPIPTRDYYRIQAVFATTQFADRNAEFLDTENQNIFAEQAAYLKQRIESYEALLQRLEAKEIEAARAWYAERGWEYATRNEKLKQGVPEAQIAPKNVGYTPEDFGLERIARKYLERHRWELDRYRPLALSVYDGPTPSRRGVSSRISLPKDIDQSGKLERTAILSGGDPFSPSVPVSPGVFSVLTGVISANANDVRQRSGITDSTTGRRSAFAAWLIDPSENPLTPRVMVNRIWQHHFGQGLVATANNFGTAGAKPSHPALLDYLATELIRHDWSAKEIHRLILTSAAYCRAQTLSTESAAERDEFEKNLLEKDPEGISYAAFASRRLAAEEIRDAVLAVSGLLNREIGARRCARISIRRLPLNHDKLWAPMLLSINPHRIRRIVIAAHCMHCDFAVCATQCSKSLINRPRICPAKCAIVRRWHPKA